SELPGAGSARPPEAGGSFGYVAPEILRGWTPERRSDQYAFGVLARSWLGTSLPPAAASVLDRMTSRLVTPRYPEIEEGWNALATELGGPVLPPAAPELLGGVAVARVDFVERALDRAHSDGRVLVRARPGIGLTRVLREIAIANAARSEDNRTLRVIDLGDAVRISTLRKVLRNANEVLVIGVPDLSPGFMWIDSVVGTCLREEARGIATLELPPLRTQAFGDLLFASTGAFSRPFAEQLGDRSEGHLATAAEEFTAAWREAGPDPDHGAKWLAERPRPEILPGPRPETLAPDVLGVAGLAADLPRALAEECIRTFAGPSPGSDLSEAGILRPDEAERVRFVTESWRRLALKHAPDDAEEIHRWLHERHTPDPLHTDETLAALRRARALGETEDEGRWLLEALRALTTCERLADAGRLVAHGLLNLDASTAAEEIDELIRLTGADQGELATFLANIHAQFGTVSARPYWQQAAQGVGPRASRAIVELCRSSIVDGDESEVRRNLATSRSLEESFDALPRGTTAILEAWRDLRSGDRDAARHKAELAAQHSASQERINALQVLLLTENGDPRNTAMELLGLAENAPSLRSRLQIYTNVSTRLQDIDPRFALTLCERSLELIQNGSQPDVEDRVRLNRASLLVDLGRCEDGLREVIRLLSRRTVGSSPARVARLLGLASACTLRLGRCTEAIDLAIRGLTIGLDTGGHALGLTAAPWVEAVLCSDCTSRVAEMRELAPVTPTQLRRAGHPVTALRLDAHLARADRGIDAAIQVLRAGEADIIRTARGGDRAGFWLHLTSLMLPDDQANGTERIASAMEESLRGEHGRIDTYVRASLLVSLARVRLHRQEGAEGTSALEQAIVESRRYGYRLCLAEALRLRAHWTLSSSEAADDQS
ncbi:MAG: hypothetical protein KC591_09415, partial [Gemmatimonadetes bacterium]|nr:hypothetical protein [Gemmatimonadota bacterium]